MTNRSRPHVVRTVVTSVVLLLALSVTTLAFAATNFNTFTVDSTGDVGWNTSLELDSSGHPVISYWDATNSDLKLAFCNDAADCDSPTITTVDSAGNVGEQTSLALDGSGRPIISYFDSSNGNLKLAICNDGVDCDSPTITTVDNRGDVGYFSSVAVDSSDNPVIGYFDDIDDGLRLAYCNDAVDCDSPLLRLIDNTGGEIGYFVSLAMSDDGRPIISSYDNTNKDLRLAICNNPTCTTAAIKTVDIAGDVGTYTSLALDSSGRPVIGYLDYTNNNVKIAFCNDGVDCDSPSFTIVSSAPSGADGLSLVLDSSDRPIISYHDYNGQNLMLAVCNDADCDSPTISTIDSDGEVGWDSSVALDGLNRPTISYYDWSNGDLKLALPAPTFDDVPTSYWAYNYVEALAGAGITSGCGAGNYCPENTVTRAQMAVFLERAMHGTDYSPPAPTGLFSDVPTDHWAAGWIEQLANDGVTSGCGGGNYCPDAPVTRAQMAVFLEIAKRGDSFTPPDTVGMFDDVPTDHWAAAWIEQLANDGITSGCGGGNFCPEGQVTRAQMAVFLVKAFNLPMP